MNDNNKRTNTQLNFKSSNLVNYSTAKFLTLLHRPGDVFEVRILDTTSVDGGSYRGTASGYFTDVDIACNDIQRWEKHGEATGCYVSLNPVAPDLLARATNHIKFRPKNTTRDEDITCRRWLLVDIDPQRPAGISATDAEKVMAIKVAEHIQEELALAGWPAPMLGMSGNGAYLLYRVELPNDDASCHLSRSILQSLANRFDTDKVKVDRSTFNASRIAAIFGTTKRKGDHFTGAAGIPARPHRRAWFRPITGPVAIVPPHLLQALATPFLDELPQITNQSERAARSARNNGSKLGVGDSPNDVQHCIDHLSAFPDAISGKGGSNVTLRAACECYRFGLSDEDAQRVMAWFNGKKTGGEPWTEKELMHKLHDARKKVMEAGEFGKNSAPRIILGPDENRVVDEVIAELTRVEDLYQRSGQLVKIIEDCDPPPGLRRPDGGLRVGAVHTATLREMIAGAVQLTSVKWISGEQRFERVHPPDWLPKAVEARGHWPGAPVLEAVLESPAFLADGRVLETPGYDANTGIYYSPRLRYPKVPDCPSIDDAIKAKDELLEVVEDFPYESRAHRAAFLAATLTPFARFAIDGPVPLFGFDANVRGSGKNLQADCICMIHCGRQLTRCAPPHNDEEARKRITSILLSGEPIVLLDNVNEFLGCPALDAVLTSTTWTDRLLGKSQMTGRLPARTIWIATGNNIVYAADTARRTLHIRLNSPLEYPERRTDFRHKHLLRWVRDERHRLAVAALTILRAYDVAGRPDMGIPEWGSFEAWSRLIRNAVVWCGETDPGATRQQLLARSDEDAQLLREVLDIWGAAQAGCKGMTVTDAIRRSDGGNHQLRSLLQRLSKDGQTINARSVGLRLRHLQERVCGGRRLYASHSNAGMVWSVRPAAENATSRDH